MSSQSAIRERYLRDPVPVRLGALAANLARIQSFGDRAEHGEVVRGLLAESKYFIEWTVSDVGIEIQVDLLELQRQLSKWDYLWDDIWVDPSRRADLSSDAGRWSTRILAQSGLLTQSDDEPQRAEERD